MYTPKTNDTANRGLELETYELVICIGGIQSTGPLDGPLTPPSDAKHSAFLQDQERVMTIDGVRSKQSYYDFVLGLLSVIK